jgi:putative ABC transport system permease protein
MIGLREDLTYACRSLARSPTFSLVSTLTLAVGIGLNTAMFSVVSGVLLEPLAFRDPSRLMSVAGRLARSGNRPVLLSGGLFRRIGGAVPAFEGVAALAPIRQNLRAGDLPEQVQVGWVSSNFFSLLGVDAALGRRFRDDEPSGAAMLGHQAWLRLFNGDAGAVGRSVTLDGFTYTIVGVLPASFTLDLPGVPRGIDIWKVPDTWWQNGNIWSGEHLSTGVLQFIARLNTGATEAQAREQVARFGERERALQTLSAEEGFELALVPLHASMVGDAKPLLLVLFGAVVCVLLIACANVMHLLLVRAHGRARELTVRVALGASPSRLARLMVAESIVLALLGGGGGALLAHSGIRLLTALGPASLPRVHEVGIDRGVFAFAAAIALGCAMLFGLLPALRASRAAAHIRGAGGTPDRLRAGRTIAAGQLAAAIVLVLAASLLARSLLKLWQVQPGFDAGRAITFSVSLPGTRYQRPDGTNRFLRALEDRIAVMPAVRAVGTIWPLPLSGRRWSGNYVVGVDPGGPHGLADYRLASGGVFDALGVRLLDGRTFLPDERRDVIVVSRSFARQAWPDQTPIGRVVQAAPWGGNASAFDVIGVVDDVRGQTLRADPTPALYFDMRRWSWTDWEMNVVVRVPGEPGAIVPVIRSELGRLDDNVPMAQIRLMTAYVADDLAANRFALTIVGAFAAVAMTLAVLGLYGVLSYAVGQRAREFGVRMALGADRRRIIALVLGDGIRLAALGVGAGLLAALWLTQALEGMLFGTAPHDPATFAGVAAVLTLVAMLACYVPARRASRVEPLAILRAE